MRIKEELGHLGVKTYTGKKICQNCVKKIQPLLNDHNPATPTTATCDIAYHPGDNEELEVSLESINSSLSNFATPIKTKKVIRMSRLHAKSNRTLTKR